MTIHTSQLLHDYSLEVTTGIVTGYWTASIIAPDGGCAATCEYKPGADLVDMVKNANDWVETQERIKNI